jgi:hypothetical protein
LVKYETCQLGTVNERAVEIEDDVPVNHRFDA